MLQSTQSPKKKKSHTNATGDQSLLAKIQKQTKQNYRHHKTKQKTLAEEYVVARFSTKSSKPAFFIIASTQLMSQDKLNYSATET